MKKKKEEERKKLWRKGFKKINEKNKIEEKEKE